MTRSDSLKRLFRAYDRASDSGRGAIYLERVGRFTEATVDGAVTRVLDRWVRVSLPPVAVLVQACGEVFAEVDARRVYERRGEREAPEPLTQEDKTRWRITADLFREGVAWCYREREFMPCGEAWHPPYTVDPWTPAPSTAEMESALAAVMRGDLIGDPKVKAWRNGTLAPDGGMMMRTVDQVLGRRTPIERQEHEAALEAVRQKRRERAGGSPASAEDLLGPQDAHTIAPTGDEMYAASADPSLHDDGLPPSAEPPF